MRRTARLFEIIQILRNAHKPITATKISELLEVSTRTIYRDIASLQAMRTPIDGEVGMGYIMRKGYDLPPLNFNEEEIEAIVVGLSLLARTGDSGLLQAASKVSNKIDKVKNNTNNLFVSEWGAKPPNNIDIKLLRDCIRNKQKLLIDYIDETNKKSSRTILPFAVIYYIDVVVLAAWCELRQDYRHFRVDRILGHQKLDYYFEEKADKLRENWEINFKRIF